LRILSFLAVEKLSENVLLVEKFRPKMQKLSLKKNTFCQHLGAKLNFEQPNFKNLQCLPKPEIITTSSPAYVF